MPTRPFGRNNVTATEAVLVDALGTLVDLEPPWVGLRPLVSDEISDTDLVEAVRAEMAYYRDHACEGRDPESLADLRERCAEVLSSGLGSESISAEQLVDAIRFAPFPDAIPSLEALGDRGMKLICVSNWDVSLAEVLDRCGLLEKFDDVVSSARAGISKPAPEPFELALDLASCERDRAIHVGDSLEEDVSGALALGISPLFLDRESSLPASEIPKGVPTINSLTEIENHLVEGKD